MAGPYKHSRSSRRNKTLMNIVPLIDVLIVLLFFFITTMQFKRMDNFNINPPQIETAGPNSGDERIIIAVTKFEEFYVNNKSLTKEAVTVEIKKLALAKPGQAVLLVADEDAPLKSVTWVMDQCRKNKLFQVKLQSR